MTLDHLEPIQELSAIFLQTLNELVAGRLRECFVGGAAKCPNGATVVPQCPSNIFLVPRSRL